MKEIIGCAIRVHRELGPGLLKSTYARCFRLELAYRKIRLTNEVWLPILPVHMSQLHTYVRLSRATQGVLFNFSHPSR